MTVYVDVLLGLNTAVNYLLLRGAASMGGCPVRRLRLLAAACLGGVYAALSLLPGLAFLGSLPVQLLCAAAMSVISFGLRKTTVRQTLFFLALSFAFGGAVLLAVQKAEPDMMVLGGRAYYAVSTPALLLLAGLLYGLAALVLAGWGTHTGGDILPLTLELGGRQLTVKALRDTGNTLRDPVTGQSVLVADWQALTRLLPEEPLTQSRFQDPASLLEALSPRHPSCKFRLMPYRAVGVETGLLLALRCKVTEPKQRPRETLVAFSPTAVSCDGRFEALTGGQIT